MEHEKPAREVLTPSVDRFTVRATDPDGDLLALRWLNPLPGDVSVTESGSEAERVLSIEVAVECSGSRELVFRADDLAGHRAVLRTHFRTVGRGHRTPWVLADVTGNRNVDVVAGSSVAGLDEAGAVYVWESSTNPSGDPDRILAVPGTTGDEHLGDIAGKGQGIQCVDVSGDGICDVIVASDQFRPGDDDETGAIYVWLGRPIDDTDGGGPLPPTATLHVPWAHEHFELFLAGEIGVQCVELTGDGILDIVTASSRADEHGIPDSGAIYLWAGQKGGWSGVVAPVSEEQALRWFESGAILWAVVAAPWVLVQEPGPGSD